MSSSTRVEGRPRELLRRASSEGHASLRSEADIVAAVEGLNDDPNVHGILVQLPLPPHVDEAAVLKRIRADKDADGFHEANVARLVSSGL